MTLVKNVLFLFTGTSARSLGVDAIVRHLGGGGYNALLPLGIIGGLGVIDERA
jgi:hypothetical protein